MRFDLPFNESLFGAFCLRLLNLSGGEELLLKFMALNLMFQFPFVLY